MELAIKTTEIITATIIAIYSMFSDGLELLNKKEFVKAEQKFSEVIKKDITENHVRDLAFFYRAQCRLHQKKMDAALKDFSTCMQITNNKKLRAQATQIFTMCGGKLEKAYPIADLEKFADSAFKMMSKNDQNGLQKILDGDLLGFFNTMKTFEEQTGEGIFSDVFEEISEEMKNLTIEQNKKTGDGIIKLKIDEVSIHLGCQMKNNQWKISTLDKFDMPDEFDDMPDGFGGDDDFDEFDDPDWFGGPDGFGGDDDFEGVPDGFGGDDDMPPPDMPPPDMPPPDMPGEIQEQLRDRAVKQKVEKTIKKKSEIPKEKQAMIKALIKQLGAKDFKNRKEARQKLKKHGANAVPFLLEEKDNKDPEIRMSVKELLENLG